VTPNWHYVCERRAKRVAPSKTLAALQFLNRRGEGNMRADRQETSTAADFAGAFTFH
jgi:hypothetical protein